MQWEGTRYLSHWLTYSKEKTIWLISFQRVQMKVWKPFQNLLAFSVLNLFLLTVVVKFQARVFFKCFAKMKWRSEIDFWWPGWTQAHYAPWCTLWRTCGSFISPHTFSTLFDRLSTVASELRRSRFTGLIIAFIVIINLPITWIASITLPMHSRYRYLDVQYLSCDACTASFIDRLCMCLYLTLSVRKRFLIIELLLQVFLLERELPSLCFH